MKTLNKYTQLNLIDDIKEPHYNGHDPEVYIAKWKVNRSKLDIKLRFAGVNPTSGFYGDWYLPRKRATSRKTININGLECYVIKWQEFDKLIINERDLKEIF